VPAVPPRGEELYREEISITPMKFLAAFEVLLGILFLGMALVQVFSGPVVSDPPPAFVWFLMAAVFLGTAWFITSFITYSLTVETGAVNLSFGRFKTTVRYEDIESSEQDKRSGLAYGGWGYRVNLTKDGWVKAYTLVGKHRIDLKLKTGRYRHIVFSTDQPETVMEILRGRLKNAPGHVRSPF
jgi:hypothetical protein